MHASLIEDDVSAAILPPEELIAARVFRKIEKASPSRHYSQSKRQQPVIAKEAATAKTA
jgi:hypothetical protein